MKQYSPAIFLSGLLVACGASKQVARRPADFPRSGELAEIRRFEKGLGLDATGNLSRYSEDTDAFHRCYYTEKLKLPASYEDLRMKNGSASGCDVDEERYDLFFYRAESVAGSRTPVTSALAEASEERFTVVVAHEDFHRQEHVRKLPASFEEAAATLLGLLSGAEFAAQHYGVDSPQHRRLRRDSETFLRKARLVNRYHQRARDLYRHFDRDGLSKREALAGKQRLFDELSAECQAIEPAPASFNACPGALNNAGLAFDMNRPEGTPPQAQTR